MDKDKVDPSLAEVRRWREDLQKDLQHLNPAEEIEEVHRRAQDLVRAGGYKLRFEEPRVKV